LHVSNVYLAYGWSIRDAYVEVKLQVAGIHGAEKVDELVTVSVAAMRGYRTKHTTSCSVHP
jgi:hypothetical protein